MKVNTLINQLQQLHQDADVFCLIETSDESQLFEIVQASGVDAVRVQDKNGRAALLYGPAPDAHEYGLITITNE